MAECFRVQDPPLPSRHDDGHRDENGGRPPPTFTLRYHENPVDRARNAPCPQDLGEKLKSKCKAQRFVELSSLEPHSHNEGNSTAAPERTLLKSPEASFRSCRGSLCLISTHSHSCSALKARQLVARLSRLGNFRWFVGAEAVYPCEHTPVPDLRLLWPRAACVSATPPAGCPVGNNPPSFSAPLTAQRHACPLVFPGGRRQHRGNIALLSWP